MNNSSLSSEFLTRAFRSLKQAKESLEEGDLKGFIINAYDEIENISKSLLVIYGFFPIDYHSSQYLNVIITKLSETEIVLVRKLQLLEERLYPLTLIDEASLKDTVIIRNFEAKALEKEIEEIFELANKVFDEFHS